MFFAAIGIDHRCQAEIREKAAFSETQKVEFSALLAELGILENVILSTCNRSEVYCFSREEQDLTAEILALYGEYFQISDNLDWVNCYQGEEAIRHIFRVAAGLESAIVGEDEILRQMKESFLQSQKLMNTGKVFNHLFQEALHWAREIKSQLKISEIPLSPGYIGLKFLQKEAGSFQSKNLLIIGFGEIGQKFFHYAQDCGFAQITICNRSQEKVKKVIGANSRAVCRHFQQWNDCIQEADFLIIATDCPHYILRKERMEWRKKPLYLLDMSIPRNVESLIGELEDYYLFNVDDLSKTAEANRVARQLLAQEAEKIIALGIANFQQWLKQLKEDEVIDSLNQSVERILEKHLDYLFHKIQVNDKQKSIISRTMKAAIKKAVLNPIVVLKSMEDPEKRRIYSQAMQELFQLN